MSLHRKEKGQILAEYAYLLLMGLAVAAILLIMLEVFTEYGWRVSVLVGWEPWL